MKAKVFHAELWGLREDKYSWLLKKDIKTTKWKRLQPKGEFYLFAPRDDSKLKRYKQFTKVTDIFLVNSVGIVTSRDDFVTDFDKNNLSQKIRVFKNLSISDEMIRQTFHLQDTSKFKLKTSRIEIAKQLNTDAFIKKMLYRPFDERWVFYHDLLIERMRADVMSHMWHKNIALITVRQVAEKIFNHAFVSDKIINYRVTLSAKGGCYLFPLYLYGSCKKPNPKKLSPLKLAGACLIAEPESQPYDCPQANLSDSFRDYLKALYKTMPSPEEIFYYIYAVLYSNTYRTRYAEFLKIDFPKVPFTKELDLFKKLSEYGKHLAELHLLKSTKLNNLTAQFKVAGTNKVQTIRYTEGRVYINDEQYFEVVPEDVWQYKIGGYKILEKWLKDKKGRELSLDDTQTYCRIITAISKTIEIQRLIDEIYEDVEGSLDN